MIKIILFLLAFLLFLSVVLLSFLLTLKKNQKLVWGLFFIVSIFSVSLYFFVGNPKDVIRLWEKQAQAKEVARVMRNIHSPRQVISKLKRHLKIYPKSAKGWFLLGSLYLDQREYHLAAIALKKAYRLQPDKPVYAVSFVESNYFSHAQTLSKQDRLILTWVLKHHSKNILALNLLALDAYHRGRTKEAVQRWTHLLSFFSEGTKERALLLEMIAKAKKEPVHG